jgi:hypothetical protein
MTLLMGFLYGALSGVFAELLGLFELRRKRAEDLPDWLKSPFYWVVTCLMISAGSVLEIVYQESDMALKPILAVNIGASAPLLIRAFISQSPPLSPGKAK